MAAVETMTQASARSDQQRRSARVPAEFPAIATGDEFPPGHRPGRASAGCSRGTRQRRPQLSTMRHDPSGCRQVRP